MDPAAMVRGQAEFKEKWVQLTGVASTDYDIGTGVCYNGDYGTPADVEGERDTKVEAPSSSNNHRFAGVLKNQVCFSANETEKWCQIYEPGGYAHIALYGNTVVNASRLTCLHNGGANTARFGQMGFPGRGSAIPKQTITNVLESHTAGTNTIVGTDMITLTVDDSSDFEVGVSRVMVLAGENDGTATIVPGLYNIASITSDTVIVLDAIISDVVTTGTITVSYVVIDGDYPTCLAYLEDGVESGMIDWISPLNAGEVGQAYSPYGKTYVGGVGTLAADCDVTFADGIIFGQRKGFFVIGDIGTSDFTLDFVANGLQLDGSALTEVLTLDDVGDAWYGEWMGIWRTIGLVAGASEG